MRRIIDGLITAVALLFVVPTILVLVSWNAIPGDSLYPLKSGLENATLLLLSGTPLVPQVSMKYTDRRLGEATLLLDKKGSSAGYSLLVAEAAQTKNYISEKGDVAAATKFSSNIDGYKVQIEKKKAEIRVQQGLPPVEPTATPTVELDPTVVTDPSQSATPTVQPTSTFTPTPSQAVVIVEVPQAIVIEQETPEVVLENLEEAEAQLDQIQEEIQQAVQTQQFSNSDDDDQEDSDKGKGRDKDKKRDD